MSSAKFVWIIAFFLLNATVRCAEHFGSGTDSDDSKNIDDELDKDDEWDIDDGKEKEVAKHLDIGKDKEVATHVDNEHDLDYAFEIDGHYVLIRGKWPFSDINLKNMDDVLNYLRSLKAIGNQDFELIPKRHCPHGFHFLPKARSCYKVIYEEHNWTSAGQRCRDLNPKAHLAAITSRDENKDLKTYLRLELGRIFRERVCGSPYDHERHFWTSGQRMFANKCRSPFVWKISADKHLPRKITKGLSGEPNCLHGTEHCLHMYMSSRKELGWNDLSCDHKICPLCEYDPE